MLEGIGLRSFQIHDRLDVDLSAPIVSIVGSSDAGKSSVLRALRWLCTGTPPRSPMPTWGSDKVRVKLRVDGKTVERRQSKSENCYTLDGKQFDAVGRGAVPDEVARLLNVGAQTFQNQHGSHFWLADTPGEVARQLNAAVNLDLIDSSLANAASEVRDAKHEEATCRDRMAAAEVKAEELKWAEDADHDLKALERLNSKIEDKRQESLELTALVREGRKAEGTSREALTQSSQRQTALGKLLVIADRHAELVGESIELGNLLGDVRCKTEKASELAAKALGLEKELGKVRTCPTCQRPL